MSTKQSFQKFQQALYHGPLDHVENETLKLFAPDAQIHLAHPIETLDGPNALFAKGLKPLYTAIPDCERRDVIVVEGQANSDTWLGCCGFYTGTFSNHWMGIPANDQMVSMRYHEFFRFENNQIVEMQSLWDIPDLMMQVGCWPRQRGYGHDGLVFAPASQDGLQHSNTDGTESLKIVGDMLEGLSRHATGGVAAMQLEKFWHPKFNWYGPAGIGTSRGIKGFRNYHQIPFLKALPDRVAHMDAGAFFAEGPYVGYTAWPGMTATHSGDDWLGLEATGKAITMRSLDFWRIENGLICENWVLVDILDIFSQLGINVFADMRKMLSTQAG